MVRSSKRGTINEDYGDLVAELDAICARLDTLESPSGESLGSTLTRARDSVAELLDRRIYAAEQSFSQVVNYGDALPASTPTLAPITFTITKRRRVRLQASAYIGMLAFSSGAGAAVDPRILVRIRLGITPTATGVTDNISSSVSTGAGYLTTLRTLSRRADRPQIDDFRTLDAGEYTASYIATVEILDGTGGSVTIDTPKLSVSILEPA